MKGGMTMRKFFVTEKQLKNLALTGYTSKIRVTALAELLRRRKKRR